MKTQINKYTYFHYTEIILEFGNLLRIENNYEKIVVSADEFAEDYKGIKHMHIRKFLANGSL